jgi:teichoic acid transport system permease protein
MSQHRLTNVHQLTSNERSRTEYLRSLWERRHFAWKLASAEAQLAHADTALGNVWLLLNPLTQMGVYFVVFGLLIDVNRGVENYLAFLAVGIFVYSYSQRSITNSSNSLQRNSGLVRTMYFPRALLPVSATINSLLLFLPGLAVAIIVALASGVRPGPSILLAVPLLAAQTSFNLGLGLIGARAVQRVTDTSQLLPYLFRLGFYGSGVLYLVDAYIDDPAWRTLFAANPFYSYLTLWRSYLLEMDHTSAHWISVLLWLLVLPIGFVFFAAKEESYGWMR